MEEILEEGKGELSADKRKSLTSAELMRIFTDEMHQSASFWIIGDEDNPCHIEFEGREFYVYIKNISPAYFGNPDVSRAQMTGVDTLLKIKEGDELFILLGYDADNKVFAAWSPHVAKQRIGTAQSPSLYSRFSWQRETAERGDFTSHELKNEGSVLLFPQERIAEFLNGIESYFPDTTEYVAMGSKRRKEANAAYRELTNKKNIQDFADFLKTSGIKPQIVEEYVSTIERLLDSSLVPAHRKIFLAYDTLDGYRLAVNQFLNSENVRQRDSIAGDKLSVALPSYIDYLIRKYTTKPQFKEDEEEKSPEVAEEEEPKTAKPKEDLGENADTDYETPFTDEHGILTRIANPKLIDLLREDLNSAYPCPSAGLSTVEDFYGDRFPNMEISHWMALFNKIDWANPYDTVKVEPQQNTTKRSGNLKIRVVLEKGTEICEKHAANTLVEVIKYAGIEKVRNLNITMGPNGGSPLICTGINTKHSTEYKELGDGLYVNTLSNTKTKFRQIEKINSELNLNMQIFLE